MLVSMPPLSSMQSDVSGAVPASGSTRQPPPGSVRDAGGGDGSTASSSTTSTFLSSTRATQQRGAMGARAEGAVGGGDIESSQKPALRRAIYIKLRDLVDMYNIDPSTCSVRHEDTASRDDVDDVEETSASSDNNDVLKALPPFPQSPTSPRSSILTNASVNSGNNQERKKLVNPSSGGYNFCLLVGSVKVVVDKFRVDRSRVRLAEVQVGDETGTVSLRARDEQIDLLQSLSSDPRSFSSDEDNGIDNATGAGAVVLRNCTVELFQNKHLRLAVTKWGKMSIYPDDIPSTPRPPSKMNTEWNFSLADLSYLAWPRKGGGYKFACPDTSSRSPGGSPVLESPQISAVKIHHHVPPSPPWTAHHHYPPLPSMQGAEAASPTYVHPSHATLMGQWKVQHPFLSQSSTSLEESTARMTLAPTKQYSARTLGVGSRQQQQHMERRRSSQSKGSENEQQRQYQHQHQQHQQHTHQGQSFRHYQQQYSTNFSPSHQQQQYHQHLHQQQQMHSFAVPQHYGQHMYSVHHRQHGAPPPYVHHHPGAYPPQYINQQNQQQQVHVMMQQHSFDGGRGTARTTDSRTTHSGTEDREASATAQHQLPSTPPSLTSRLTSMAGASTSTSSSTPTGHVSPGCGGPIGGQAMPPNTVYRQPASPYYPFDSSKMVMSGCTGKVVSAAAATPSPSPTRPPPPPPPPIASPSSTQNSSVSISSTQAADSSRGQEDSSATCGGAGDEDDHKDEQQMQQQQPSSTTKQQEQPQPQQHEQRQSEQRIKENHNQQEPVWEHWLERSPSHSSAEIPAALSMSSFGSFGAMNAQAQPFDPNVTVPAITDYDKDQVSAMQHNNHQHYHQHQYQYYSYPPHHPDGNVIYATSHTQGTPTPVYNTQQGPTMYTVSNESQELLGSKDITVQKEEEAEGKGSHSSAHTRPPDGVAGQSESSDFATGDNTIDADGGDGKESPSSDAVSSS